MALSEAGALGEQAELLLEQSEGCSVSTLSSTMQMHLVCTALLLAVIFNPAAARAVLPVERRAARRSLAAVEPVTNVNDFEYFVQVQIGNQLVRLQVDTGSSDVSRLLSACTSAVP